jgi:hypothetical protein
VDFSSQWNPSTGDFSIFEPARVSRQRSDLPRTSEDRLLLSAVGTQTKKTGSLAKRLYEKHGQGNRLRRGAAL